MRAVSSARKAMKKISFINTNESINIENRLFDSTTYALGDGLLRPFSELAHAARLDGYECATYHVISPESADAIVCLDMPAPDLLARIRGLDVPKYLYIFECPLIRPLDWNDGNHAIFEHVFTYDSNRWSASKYLEYLMPYSMRRTTQVNIKTRFLCLVASNKVILRQVSGYDDRRHLIEYFRKTKTEGFSLYGRGWEFYCSGSRVLNRVLAKFGPRFPWLGRFCTPLQFYRGALENKLETISQYKFIYCNENFSHPGYVTEKIFDAMWAGSVPVYSGPPDIEDFIPSGCYVNVEAFQSVALLVQYLQAMGQAEYQQYLSRIQAFLYSDQAAKFSSDAFYQGLKSVLDKAV